MVSLKSLSGNSNNSGFNCQIYFNGQNPWHDECTGLATEMGAVQA